MQLLLNNPTHPKKKRKKKQPINKNRPWYQTVIFMQTHQTDLKRKKRSSVLTTELAAQQRDTANNNNNNKLTLLVHSYCIHISQELPGKKTRKNSVGAAEQSKANADWRETVLRDNRCARGRARNNRRSEKMGIN
jgi:ribonuclease D